MKTVRRNSNRLGQRRGCAAQWRSVVETLEDRRLLATNVLQWHNDPAGTGLNAQEVSLTPSNVNNSSFGKLLSYPVQGQVYAQPLYVADLSMPGLGTRDVVFVATQNNDVYALDANSTAGPTGGVLWHVNLGTAATTPSPFIGFRYGPFRDVSPQVGITSTPVIDLGAGTIYIDAFTNDIVGQDAYSHHIHAIDIHTGQHKVPPKLVTASVQGNGVGGNGTTVTFAANRHIQRAAMTMFNGVLYAAYAAYADTDPYHGWILGYDPDTLEQVAVFNTTPNRDPDSPDFAEGEAGIWQSGAGLVTDGTHLYLETGNGDYDPSVGAWGDSVLKITPDASTPASPNVNGWGLRVTDYFTPFNEQQLADADADLGSAGVLVLPDQPGARPHQMVGIGKQGIIYLMDRDDLGQHNSSFDDVIQKVSLGRGFWGNPAYFNQSLYYHAVNDVLKRFSLSNGTMSAAPAAQSSITYPTWPSATPSVSANGTANGIVWDVQFESGQQVLHAYDATTLAELYNSNQNAARDKMGGGVKFITPTIADGRVFVGSSGALTIYGLIQPVTDPPTAPSDLDATPLSASGVQLTWVDNADNEAFFEIERSSDNVNFTQLAVVGVDVRTYTDTDVSPNTRYYYRVRAGNAIGDSAYTPAADATTLPPTGATHIYRFDAGSGTTAIDSATGNHGTLVGSPAPQWVTPGRAGAAALSFNGNGVYNSAAAQSAVSVTSNLATILGSSSTMTFWVQTTQTGDNNHALAPAITGVEQVGSANDINWGTLDATGRIGLYVGDAGGVYSTRRVNDGQWHHVAMTRDADTGRVQIYVDGVLNATHLLQAGDKTTPFTLLGAATVAAANGTQTGATYFNGRLDEVRIYNAVLGGNEIAAQAIVPATPVLQSATVVAGPVVHLVFSSPSTFAETIEISRKTGVNGTFEPIATVSGGTTLFDDTDVLAGTTYYYALRAITAAGASATSNVIGVMPKIPTIVGVHTFYNGSNFDGQNGSSNLTDRAAIATDKKPLLPGHTATFENYTSYSRGLTGIIIDVADIDVLPRIDDFEFRVGNSSDLATFTQAPTPAYINTYPGRGPNGATQITIIWHDNEIQNQWLMVRVLAQPHLNLAADYTFFFGNAIGDTGDSAADARVTATDASRVSANQSGSAIVTNLYDINRDGVVNTVDVNLVNANQTGSGTPLQLISLGSAPTVATPAGAAPAPVNGTTTALSVLGADSGGEANLTYTWSLIGTPPAPVTFAANGTNAAKNTTATFAMAGAYQFLVTIANPSGMRVTSPITVQVNQSATSIAMAGAASQAVSATSSYVATQYDQFGNAMAVQPAFAWSISSGPGVVNSSGAFTSPRTAGSTTIAASASGLTGELVVTTYDDVLTWYRADATSGTTLTDSSGNNQPANLTGGYNFTPGVSGNALTLSGGHATLPTGTVAGLNDFTVAAWIRVSALEAWARVFDFGSSPAVNMFLTPVAGDTGRLRFAITTGGGGSEQKLDGPAIAANTWTHVAVTLAGNSATLYINGVAYASNDAMTLHPTNLGVTTQNYLGRSQYPDPLLQGSIDDFRIYSRALTPQQVASLGQVIVTTPAAASPAPVNGTTTGLSVLATDVDAGESGLTYTWSTTGAAPAPVTFSANSTNAAKNTTATFGAAGTYNFLVTITNAAGIAATSSVTVVVNPVAAGYAVSPAEPTVETGMTAPFTFGGVDQFGNPFGPPVSSVTWSLTSGAGSVSSSGVFTAPNTVGSATITASAAGLGSDSATVTVIDSKRAWYQANSTTGNTLADSSGQGRTGTISGAHTWSAGIAGNALNLTGGFASLPAGIVSDVTDFTIATWVRVTNLQNWARIFDFGNNTDSWMFLTPSAAGSNALRFSIKTAGNAAQDLNGPAMTTNTWTHVAVTLAGSVATMFVNGVAVATNPNVTYDPAALGNTAANFIGESQWAADPLLQGSIDDFRIYTRAISSGEVAQLVRPTIVNAPAASAAPVTTTSTTLSVLASDVTRGEAALTYTWATLGTPPAPVTFSANGTNAAKNTTATFSAAGTYTFSVTVADASGFSTTGTVDVIVQATQSLTISPPSTEVNAGATQQFTATIQDQFGAVAAQPSITWSLQSGVGSISASGLYTAPATGGGAAVVRATSGDMSATANVQIGGVGGALAWYKFNESSGVVAADSSGLGNNGALNGAAGFAPGTSGNALSLSGGHASLPSGIVSSLGGDFTIATWVRLDALATWSRIFDFGTGTGVYMFLTPAAGGTNRPRFAITTSGNGAEQVVNSAVAIATNVWTHVAVTLAGNTATLYVNGVNQGSNANVTLRPASLGNTTQNYIGDSQFAADPALNGSVDDFRIYGRALSTSDIASLAAQPRFAYVFDGRLHVDFDAVAAAVPISLGVSGEAVSVSSGGTTLSFASSGFADILISGTAASDPLTLNATMPKPFTFAGGGGNDSLTLGAAASAAFDTDLSLATPGLALTVTGTATFAAPQRLAALTVTGTVSLAAGGDNVLDTDMLAVTGGGVLDVADNLVLVRSAQAGTFDGAAYNGVQGLVQRAYNFGAWDQPGLTTSEDRAGLNAGPLSGTTTLAVATAAQVLFIGETETGVFAGRTVTGSTVIVMYTYAGDLNMDGLVDGADYGVIDNYVQFPGTDGYANGDFNYDGVIDGADYGVIDNTIQLQGPPFAFMAAPMPTTEPSSEADEDDEEDLRGNEFV